MSSTHEHGFSCCHFSSDGKLLACAGSLNDKVYVLATATLQPSMVFETNQLGITDIRFNSSSSFIATSSNQMVKIWDANNAGQFVGMLQGHRGDVLSLDFHPKEEHILCSCDDNEELRRWDVRSGLCTKIVKVGAAQLRFQPTVGKYLAANTEKNVSLFDATTLVFQHCLEGHDGQINSICWRECGDALASLSADCAKVWRLETRECLYKIGRQTDGYFKCCVFDPVYQRCSLVIGRSQYLELCKLATSGVVSTKSTSGHGGIVSIVDASRAVGLLASVCVADMTVKLWNISLCALI
ncbi:hypothetical protein ABFS82_05G128700 [Erythranthe guttata]|uniref:transcriptional corepressor LEUNIG-like isoform X1 n=1 Tax=Erythranthe guttata TaxID=4155 RepID=UPI00064E135B|nr:PREDICTED: transcriptional corepressor LEUNIG-like isoform X1 [Erythranthe guttata]XP_012847236.1 PREDICTED: transcriptional corepressor LEUNIG-like isoform X1 [Erythranthe guttata]|eukprot:XP_012847235.1 PREDICTED: transcriptional corepressor LEUNIG-like isoform X1 [Erythranthe guttata]